MSREPTRFAKLPDSDSSEAAYVGGIIRTRRRELPSAEKMQELAGRLGPLLEERRSSPHRVLPWLGSLVLGALVVGGAVWATRPKDENVAASVSVPTAPTPRAVDVEAPPAISVDALPSVDATPSAKVRQAPAPVPDISAPRCDEVDLIDRADRKLRDRDFTGALAIAREHERACVTGTLVQERERIAIEALAKVGRVDEARARARAFEERYPTSAHRWRVRQVIEKYAY